MVLKSFLVPLAIVVIWPSAACCPAPETGQSTMVAPFFDNAARARSLSAMSRVEVSTRIIPLRAPAAMPSLPVTTASRIAGEVREVITTSDLRATSAGLLPALPPAFTSALTFDLTGSNPVTWNPALSRLAANAPPMIPRPQTPTRSAIFLSPDWIFSGGA